MSPYCLRYQGYASSWRYTTETCSDVPRLAAAETRGSTEQHRRCQVAQKCVSPSPISHGATVYLPDIYISHFTLCIAQNCFSPSPISLFRRGKSDYLDDNHDTEAFFHRQEQCIFFFVLFFRRKNCHVKLFAPFKGIVFHWNVVPV